MSSESPGQRPLEGYDNFRSISLPRRFFGHLMTVTRHKYYVAQGCFKCGLYLQGILHDMSKYSPAEFSVGVRYYHGHRSPNAVERMMNEGLSTAWLHHKGRNKHHYEYWIDFGARIWPKVFANRMPLKYVVEMVCDRRAACIVYNKDNYYPGAAWEHYQKTKEYSTIHPDTRAVLESALMKMRDEGDDACFSYLRSLLRITRGRDYSAESLGLYRGPESG